MIKYNFNDMDVIRKHLQKAAYGDYEALFEAFFWGATPQGTKYWDNQFEGFTDLDVDTLKEMLRQYDAWSATTSGSDSSEKTREFNPVDKPIHYGQGKIECIDYIEDFLTKEEYIGYLRGNIAKYLHRYRYKNGLEDLKKAQWYLGRLIDLQSKM